LFLPETKGRDLPQTIQEIMNWNEIDRDQNENSKEQKYANLLI